jgi:hypothetical protein
LTEVTARRYLEYSRLLETPEGESLGERGIARLARRLTRSRHLRREELVREEVQRAGEHNTGVVPRLATTKYELVYSCSSILALSKFQYRMV